MLIVTLAFNAFFPVLFYPFSKTIWVAPRPRLPTPRDRRDDRRHRPVRPGDPMSTWDPAQYLRFADHRSRPAFDLLNRVDHDDPEHMVDLGCGTGDMARTMKERWPWSGRNRSVETEMGN